MWIVETKNGEGIKKIVASSNYEEIIEFVIMFYPLTSLEVEELKEEGQTCVEGEVLYISVIPYYIG